MAKDDPPAVPAPGPLFTLDLGENGGTFAPTSLVEVTTWIQQEQTFWVWIQQQSYGNHTEGLRQAINGLNQASNAANEAPRHKDSNPQRYQQEISAIQHHVQEVFVNRKLPHSSTPLGKRIEAYRAGAGNSAASYFASVFAPQQGHHFQPQDLSAWRGLIEGVVDRYDLLSALPEERRTAADLSFEQLRIKAENLVGEKRAIYDALHRDYGTLSEQIRTTSNGQMSAFDTVQSKRSGDFDNLIGKHAQEMEALRKTFREEIALRAPAEYWNKKRFGHVWRSWVTGLLSFAGIGGAAVGLGWLIHDLVAKTPANTQPDSWRIALLALVGVFAVWAVRLIVRMYLSNLHLATDAAERVVMVQTYLSLLEGDRLASKEDRQLILQALFRPAADGIVKDEGLPASFVEMLTRSPKG